MWIRLSGVAAIALTASCGSIAPGNVSEPVEMVVSSYERASSRYVLKTEQIRTLSKLRTLEGTAAKIEIGAQLRADASVFGQANPQTTADYERLVVASAGKAPDFDYFESDGVIYPADADALALATTYHHFEQAQNLFATAGAALPAVRVIYDAQLTGTLQGLVSPVTDTPLSQPYSRVFAILKTASTNDVPAGLQKGVVGHQYAHAVFQSAVFPGDAMPWLEQKIATQVRAYMPLDNLVRGFDEGLADYFGAALAEDPTFVRTAPGAPDEDRRLDPATPRCAPADLTNTMQQQTRDQNNPHKLGSVISALLWDLDSRRVDQQQLLKDGLVKGMKEFGTLIQASPTEPIAQLLPKALNVFAKNMPAALQARACGLIVDRFRLTRFDVPSCTVIASNLEQKCAL